MGDNCCKCSGNCAQEPCQHGDETKAQVDVKNKLSRSVDVEMHLTQVPGDLLDLTFYHITVKAASRGDAPTHSLSSPSFSFLPPPHLGRCHST